MMIPALRRTVLRRRRQRFDMAVDAAVSSNDAQALHRLVAQIPAGARDYTVLHHRVREAFLLIDDHHGAGFTLTRAAGPGNECSLDFWPAEVAGVADLSPEERDATRRDFADLIGRFVPAEAITWWQRALDAAIGDPERLIDTGSKHPLAPARWQSECAPDWSPIAVAGAGWSGSGAVFDYLRSAHRIRPVAGEGRLLEGRYGIVRLLRRSRADLKPAERIDLLRYCLLGFAPCNDWNDFRHVLNARRSSCGPGAVEFARLSALVLEQLARPGARNEVGRWGRILFDAAVEAQLGSRDGVPLLDNVVHIRHLDHLAAVVPHVTFIAVTRDPRDQYLDNLHSNPRFNPDPQRFITKYRRVRALLDTALDHHPSVRAVQFEHFVLDAETRRLVTADLIDSIGGADLEARFDHARSARNTGLWRVERDHPAVVQITRKLPEFLID